MTKKKIKNGKTIITHILLMIFALIQIYPLFWLFEFSLKDNSEIFGGNIAGLPQHWRFGNYVTAFFQANIMQYFFNSVLVTVVTIILTVIIAAMSSYAISRMIWKGRELTLKLVLMGMMVPIHAAMLPIFLIMKNLKLLNTYQSLILPYSAFSLAMAILVAGSFMESIPAELEESACIDGCGTYGIFFRIILPLMKPAFSTIAIFTFLNAWNEFMFAIVFVSDSKYKTLPVGVQELFGQYMSDWGPVGAALVIATFPTLLVYCFMSGKIQESMIMGAVKG